MRSFIRHREARRVRELPVADLVHAVVIDAEVVAELVQHGLADLVPELCVGETELEVRLAKDVDRVGHRREVVDPAFEQGDAFVEAEQPMTGWILLPGGPLLDDDLHVVDALDDPLRQCLDCVVDDAVEGGAVHGGECTALRIAKVQRVFTVPQEPARSVPRTQPTGRDHEKNIGAHGGEVVVANRASGSISVLDAASGDVLGAHVLPDNGEPMYVTATADGSRVFVGDRANSQVVVFDGNGYSVIGTVPAGAGVFHMWQDPDDRQLWVNNDIDNTATVIDPGSLTVIATVPMPADLVEAGYKPHDVVVDPTGPFAYVTLVGGETKDWVVQFNTHSFHEVKRAAVGLDPHVSLTSANKYLHVPAQNSDVVHVFQRRSLQLVTELAVPGAHGAAMSPDGSMFYTTNLPGGGADGLFAIDTASNSVIGSADTSFVVPHNVVVMPNGNLFVMHSGGTSDKVTVHAVSAGAPVPSEVVEVMVGLNPFGLAHVP